MSHVLIYRSAVNCVLLPVALRVQPKNVTRTLIHFLALLDYVSRAHEIEIRPSYVVRPSVCPSSRVIHCVAFLRPVRHCATFPFVQLVAQCKK